MHRITVGPVDQPRTSIVHPGITDDERRMIAEMMAKGMYASINVATSDLDASCAVQDPAGNLIRFQEVG